MKELNKSELNTRQKLGMTMIALITNNSPLDYVLDLIRDHALGAVWVAPLMNDLEGTMKKIKAAADYPLLVFTDAESGIGDYLVGRHNSIGCTDSEELAYTFGKVTAITARKMGYTVVCDPLLDMVSGNWACGGVVRSICEDKERVSALAAAIVRGMHDGGVLSVAKHYPGSTESGKYIDSHMAEGFSTMDKESLIDHNLYPYRKLMEAGLLDGIMTGHKKFVNIDPDYPASLSKKVIGVIRELGFEGFIITDALMMMGVVAKFGPKDPIPMAVGNGNDLALPYITDIEFTMNALYEGYEKGLISDERLDEAVDRVLATQHKTLMLKPIAEELTEEDKINFEKINSDSIFEKHDADVPPALDKNGRYYFVVLSKKKFDTNAETPPDVDTFSIPWFNPFEVTKKLRETFKNSVVDTISEFPSPDETCRFMKNSNGYETVFVTYHHSAAYLGTEEFTPRISSIITAMQVSDRISTILHFGNPFVLEELPHIPRVIIGCCSQRSVNYGLEILAGDREAKGSLTYKVNLK